MTTNHQLRSTNECLRKRIGYLHHSRVIYSNWSSLFRSEYLAISIVRTGQLTDNVTRREMEKTCPCPKPHA